MPGLTISNAKIVLRDAVVEGCLSTSDGVISAVDTGPSGLRTAENFEGDYLLPGFVELHTDNLERHLQPRPGVMWPSAHAAILAHDVQAAGAGITTVFDAVSVGEYSAASNRRQMIAATV